MTNFLEKLGKKFILSPEDENPGTIEADFRPNEWVSPDGKRIILTVMYGGDRYGGMHIKDIALLAKGVLSVSRIVMTRIRGITQPDSLNVECQLTLKLLEFKKLMIINII